MYPISAIIFHDTSAWWVLVCLALGLGLSFLQYRKDRVLASKMKKWLFAIRTLAVSLIAFLLSAPLIKTTTTEKEKPSIVIAADVSASMPLSMGKKYFSDTIPNTITQLKEKLSDKYDVAVIGFGKHIHEPLAFEAEDMQTNFSDLFKHLSLNYADRNLGAVILFSDGIYNRGANPIYERESVNAPIYVFDAGKSTPKADLYVAKVNHNKTVYLGNSFQLEVVVEARQCAGSLTKLVVEDESKVIFSKPISVNSNSFRTKIPVVLNAEKTGIKQLRVKLAPVAKEELLRNNTQTLFVEVLSRKTKVLVLAAVPHPDVAAIKNAIENSQSYEVEVCMADDFSETKLSKCDVLVLHQLPSTRNGNMMERWKKWQIPTLFVLGAQSDLGRFNAVQSRISVNSNGSLQEVLPKYNENFFAFSLSGETKSKIEKIGPLTSFFGSYSQRSDNGVMLWQRVGRVDTDMPLLLFGREDKTNVGILFGEGFWRWRMDDFQDNGSHEAVGELMAKTIRFLLSEKDKKKFKAYPQKTVFDEGEDVLFNAELYNEANELNNDADVDIQIKQKSGKTYNFLFSKTANKTYELNANILPTGIYEYVAVAKYDDVQKHFDKGKFIIAEQNVELNQTSPDRQLLYALAKQSGGMMFSTKTLDVLVDSIRHNEKIKTVVYERKEYAELLDKEYLFFLIVLLLGLEWFLRKQNGLV